MSAPASIRVAVVVLGDLGRSPRMLYHACALGDTGAAVDLIGYRTHELPAAVAAHPRIRVHRLWAPVPGAGARLPRPVFLAYALGRAARQTVDLAWTMLVRASRPDVVLVQNPPAMPTLAVALVVCRLRGARLVVDWHNLGYALLGLALGARHPVVRAAAWYERVLGRRADAHLCVSRAFRDALAARWGIDGAAVLYDRPAAAFVPSPAPERAAILARLAPLLDARFAAAGSARPALVVSPTSWTADEDFPLLLAALGDLDRRLASEVASARPDPARAGAALPRIVVVLTGDGPLRPHYERRLAALPLPTIAVRTLWLAPADYPRLLAAADLGLSLHRSASGLDLPMKVADMFGAGIPVCALDYGPCLHEQIDAGTTGVLFTTAAELATRLYDLLAGFPDDTRALDRLRAGVAAGARPRWSDAWKASARPLLLPGRTP
jgi:beta-1,4-mannosyltransferase